MVGVWGWLVVFFKGKQVAILGPRASGKTTLYDFLDKGTVNSPGGREQTIAVESRHKVYRKDFGLALHEGYDVPGSDAYYEEWRRGFEKAHIIFYLLDVHRLRTEPAYAARVSQDGREMSKWGIGERKVYILGTHMDTDPLAASSSKAEYCDDIMAMDVVEALRSRTKHGRFAIGQLKTDKGANDLLKSVLQ